jgi:hypothetical protein
LASKPTDAWFSLVETIESLGGWKGMFFVTFLIFAFYAYVGYAISKATAKKKKKV